ncbi:MAG: hypothetical protein HS110_10125 [Zoogloeaceae bacterium]|nr:hypothetical protein [Zoogloeaceae bacterium]MCK6383916.1 hypothetical protein [Rhodocyclaceae bacterium]
MITMCRKVSGRLRNRTLLLAAAGLVALTIGFNGNLLRDTITHWAPVIASASVSVLKKEDDSNKESNRVEREKDLAELLDSVLRLLKSPSIEL